MGIRDSGNRPGDGERRGYRYRPADPPPDEPDRAADDAADEEDDVLTGDDDAYLDEDYDDGDVDEEDEDERPSEFWPAAELLKGATIEDAELELSYSASVYANLPAAELRLWLRLPDGTLRLAQIDEPHAVWLYREARKGTGDFGEYPDHRFELPSSDLRALRARRQRQLIDQQLALHREILAVGEELEQLERDLREETSATANWPGTRWPD